jgi:16S rRNA (guanine1207-N2)-methyltransferase
MDDHSQEHNSDADGAIEAMGAAISRTGQQHPQKTLFLNARVCDFLNEFDAGFVNVQQYFKPYAAALEKAGFKPHPDLGAEYAYDCALVLVPKKMLEARGVIAKAISVLKPGGSILCAAGNKSGGTRLKKMLQDFGITNIAEISKSHARAAWGVKNNIDQGAIDSAIHAARVQKISGDFYSVPGLFGWDKIDKGSEILTAHLPDDFLIDFQGRGADFGCGYGYLARHALQKTTPDIHITCIDADWRAVEVCKKNLSEFENTSYLWADLTAPVPGLKNLDWVIMNPPFHEGKKTQIGIGKSFIKTAAACLRPGGVLWMVGNAHLPYEEILKAEFATRQKIHEGMGFKVFRAVK